MRNARDEVDQSEIVIAVITVEPALHAFVSQEGTGTRLKGRTSHTFNIQCSATLSATLPRRLYLSNRQEL